MTRMDEYAARNAEIFARRVTGKETLDAIAKSYGITAERVRQIVYREFTGKTASRKAYIPSVRQPPPDLSELEPFENPFTEMIEKSG